MIPKTFCGLVEYNKVRIGIDISKNSTGICFLDSSNNLLKLCNVVTDKSNFIYEKNNILDVISYKDTISEYTGDNFSEKELIKVELFNEISKIIVAYIYNEILRLNVNINEISIRVEGIILDSAMNSLWTVDYSKLFGFIVSRLYEIGFKKEQIRIYQPMSVKNKFTGIGGTQKDLTIALFKYLTKDIFTYKEKQKVDDIADAYALAYAYIDKKHFLEVFNNFIEHTKNYIEIVEQGKRKKVKKRITTSKEFYDEMF